MRETMSIIRGGLTLVASICLVSCVSAPTPPPVVVPPAPPPMSVTDKAACDHDFPTGWLSPLCYAAKYVLMADVAAGGASKPAGQKQAYLSIAAEIDGAKAAAAAPSNWATVRSNLTNAINAIQALPSTPVLQAALAQMQQALAWLPGAPR